jgi:hypothetical protein
MKKIFYEKVGRKYVPIAEYDNEYLDSFSKGNHLVMCYPGGQSRRYNIDPNYAAMIAAGRVAANEITRAIYMASELKPQQKPITEGQRKAWNKLSKEFGTERFALQHSSARDVAEAGVNAMMIEADILMTNPAVKNAYEHFLLVAELTKE